MADCSHPVQMHGLCAVCGLDLIENIDNDFSNDDSFIATDSPNFHILHSNPYIKVTAEEAARIENENMERLLGEQKLSLVVDLDQTVLHATVDPSVHDWLHDPNHPLHKHTEDIHKVALHDSPHIYFVKLRPGLQKFFTELSKLFELHVYTMGSRSYAHAVVKLIDPDSKLFHDRILSRDDNEIIENRKKLERIFPTDDRMVLVIDDRIDVWPDCRNLVQVPAYTFFVGTGDINSPTGRIDGETGIQDHTESTVINPHDDVLITIEKVLKSIHNRFFKEFEAVKKDSKLLPDVKEILSQVKSEIFEGFYFVFSGLLHQHTAYEEQDIWRVAKSFGAECEYELSDSTTHLITNRVDTEKALESQERKIPAVSPDWIFECCKKWERVNWVPFKLKISVTRRKSQKRSAAELQEPGEEEEGAEIYGAFPPIMLDRSELDEIQKELEDLEESENDLLDPISDDDGNEDEDEDNNDEKGYSEADLSDGDFTDILEDSGDEFAEE